jgi:formate dehydrogenase major subunit
MEQIKLTINGKEILTTPGKTILEVVNEHKIDKIPTLCYDKRIEPYGSCFLCVVEIEGMNKLVPSCCTPVTNGMVIHTDNERIRSSRKTALELLFSNHYADCIGPCIDNCPSNVDAQGYIALISLGKYEEALELIKKQNPLPLSIGRVCVRDCELACRRDIVDEPVAINNLKRYVADIDAKHKWIPEIKPNKNKNVAVIGGGPSGLTCAYYLTLEGYSVTIFEKLPELGGMLKYGIPEYRLPKKVLNDEIKWIIDLGINVKTNIEMGKDFNINSLFNNGFDAIYIAVGAHKASNMRLKNEDDTKGVLWGIDFLRELPTKTPNLKGTVIVVGGGNTAIDAARTALRCGADTVKIVYRRSIKEMPAHPFEIEAAREEGVEFLFLTLPKNIIRNGNRLSAIECLKMELKDAKPGERPRPVPIENSEFILECNYLIGAIGQQVDTSFNDPENECQLEAWGTIKVDDNTMKTSINGVFAGGDTVTGPYTAISAIAHGKIAAQSIGKYLNTGKIEKQQKPFLSFKHNLSEISEHELEHIEKIARNKMPELPLEKRTDNFDEVELGYSDAQSTSEVLRCMECGCSEYYDCTLRKYADDFNINISDYIGETRQYKVDNRHPFIVLDANKCINCGRCVRTCSEILEISALGFINRGFKAVIKPAMERPLLETNCISCGNCIDTCPTGAISENFPFKALGTLGKNNHRSICNFCSIGCNINYKVIDNNIFYVSNSTDEITDSHNMGYSCIKGRFGHRYLMDPDRLGKPIIKTSGKIRESEWQEAITFTAKHLKAIINKYGPDSIAVFGSPKYSNEELYLIQKLARTGLKTNNISSFSNLLCCPEQDCLDDSLGITVSTTTMDNIDKADIIVVINSDLSDENLIMELKIKAAQKKNTKLILINSSEIKLTKFVDLWVDTRRGTNTVLLTGIARELINKGKTDKHFIQNKTTGFSTLCEMVSTFSPARVCSLTGVDIQKYEQLIELLNNPDDNIVFIYNLDSRKEKAKGDLRAIANLLLLNNRINRDGNGLILLRDFANSIGLSDMGVSPQYLPGYIKFHENNEINRISSFWETDLKKIFKPVNFLEKMLRSKIKGMLIFGEDPLINTDNFKYFKGVEFLLVHDMFYSHTARDANVVLPAASYIEQEGTYTSCDRRIQKVKQILKPKCGKPNWEIIANLAGHFNKGFEYESAEEIFKEIKQINRFYKNCSINGFWAEDIFQKEFFTKNKKANFSIYDIDMTTLSPEKQEIIFSENYFKTKIKNKLMI